MLLVIDMGNTNSVFALFEGDSLVGQWRISTLAARTADEYGVWLLQAMALNGLAQDNVDAAIIATVVPDSQFSLLVCCKRYFAVEPLIVGAAPLAMNITVDVDNPLDIGADRLVNAIEAWERHHCAMVVVDFGTATTFDVITAQGVYIGGVIAPGVNLSLAALQKAAAKLPSIRVRSPKRVIGRNTISAMESGIFFGYIGLIEGVLQRIQGEYPECNHVIATGGLSSLYAASIPAIHQHDHDLTIYGLKRLYQLNV